MEIIIVTLTAIIIFGAIRIKTDNRDGTHYKRAVSLYKYSKKEYVITQHELNFYKSLHEAVSGCVIIPQAHLSMFLDHKIRGQNWSRAFSIINGKSVDFLICTEDMRPLIAIELDDSTHNRLDRQKRDAFVNSIIADADIPMLRFSANNWNTEVIKQRITHTLQMSIIER